MLKNEFCDFKDIADLVVGVREPSLTKNALGDVTWVEGGCILWLTLESKVVPESCESLEV